MLLQHRHFIRWQLVTAAAAGKWDGRRRGRAGVWEWGREWGREEGGEGSLVGVEQGVEMGVGRGPGKAGSEVLAAHVHGLPVQLWMLHHCAALHILPHTHAHIKPFIGLHLDALFRC